MKLINQIFVFLSFISLNLSLEAKSLEAFLDHETKECLTLSNDTPLSSSYTQELRVENKGDHPIKNCFPYVNQPPALTLEHLAARLADKPYPLLTLYQLWDQSLVQDEASLLPTCHPLDLLNIYGSCPSAQFNLQFLHLCQALGIKTRLVNAQGKTLFDFCCQEEEWNFLDLATQQIYLSLDNQALVSSEEVMDDPFLALRTKHLGRKEKIDFKRNWQEVARFDILDPASAAPVILDIKKWTPRAQGFDLYPGEALRFKTSPKQVELTATQRCVKHKICLEARQISSEWTYSSPLPLCKLKNRSSTVVHLIDQDITLKPGELFRFPTTDVFYVRLAFTEPPQGNLIMSSVCAQALFPTLTEGDNQIYLGAQENLSVVRFAYTIEATGEEVNASLPVMKVLNEQEAFDYCAPHFTLGHAEQEPESIWWQISSDSSFQLVAPNFDQMEAFASNIALSPIHETFLNAGETYYFRVKGSVNGQWGEWSPSYAFVCHKPLTLEYIEVEQVDQTCYELNWERWAEEASESDPIEYLIFGSNALDFIPSVYCDKQVNAFVDGEVIEEEVNDNLIAITTQPKAYVKGGLAYYRVIARKRGQLSVPSSLIHVYDQDLVQPRSVLQIVETDRQVLAKRTLFPAAYPWTETALPHAALPPTYKSGLIQLQTLLRSVTQLERQHNYEFPKVDESIWEQVRPYLLPANHPAWAKLNRIFCKVRATQTPEDFKKAGFKRWRPGRWSRVMASSHPEIKEYFVKAYSDLELGIIYDWKKWIHRIEGAKTIRATIKRNNLQEHFKVPHKWLYPLPAHPSPPKGSHYLRKNFILVAENMRIQSHEKNDKMYKHNMTRQLLDGIYTILQEAGLYDSVYNFNIPFCKDGRIAIIDTEYHHKWPVPFERLSKCYSKEMRTYWEKITHKGGRIPDGVNQPNPPRQDRRDIIPTK